MYKDYYIFKGEHCLGIINTDSFAFKKNWDYLLGVFPDKLFSVQDMNCTVDEEAVISYLKYRTGTKTIWGAIEALEDDHIYVDDGFKIIRKVKSRNSKEMKRQK